MTAAGLDRMRNKESYAHLGNGHTCYREYSIFTLMAMAKTPYVTPSSPSVRVPYKHHVIPMRRSFDNGSHAFRSLSWYAMGNHPT